MYYAFSNRISLVGMNLIRDICILFIIRGTPAGTKLGIHALQYWHASLMFLQLAVFSPVYCACSLWPSNHSREEKCVGHSLCSIQKQGHKSACIYVVWQKSNETDFLLTMNFILFTNQGYFIFMLHRLLTVLFKVVMASFDIRYLIQFRYPPKPQKGGTSASYNLLDIIQSTKLAPFQVVFEPGE